MAAPGAHPVARLPFALAAPRWGASPSLPHASLLQLHLCPWALSLPFLRICLHHLSGLQVPFRPSFTSGPHLFVPYAPTFWGAHLFVPPSPIFGGSMSQGFRVSGFASAHCLLALRLPHSCLLPTSWQPQPLPWPAGVSPSTPGGSGFTSCPACVPPHCLPLCVLAAVSVAHPGEAELADCPARRTETDPASLPAGLQPAPQTPTRGESAGGAAP